MSVRPAPAGIVGVKQSDPHSASLGEIVSYREMCNREDSSLQRGMNFFRNRPHAVVLMSLRKNAPYADRIEDDVVGLATPADLQIYFTKNILQWFIFSNLLLGYLGITVYFRTIFEHR